MKYAIVLFNLGGPDSLEAVQPFLYNLFSDPAIIRLPKFLRLFVAKMISNRRAPIAKDIYKLLGGSSPILKNTKIQAHALEAKLNSELNAKLNNELNTNLNAELSGKADLSSKAEAKCFIVMRYWHPFSAETVEQIAEYAPDIIIKLPLYPQFSTTTTASSFLDFDQAINKIYKTQKFSSQKKPDMRQICCYPQEQGFISAIAETTKLAYESVLHKTGKNPRILFSAHGLPKKIVDAGDPYQWQCQLTALAIVAKLQIPALDWVLCFQSRVGPMEWIKPATDDEILKAGESAVPLVVVPIAFVSEHSETLVEIGIEYRKLARLAGVPAFEAVPTVSDAPEFIAGLARLVLAAEAGQGACSSGTGERLCPQGMSGCCQQMGK